MDSFPIATSPPFKQRFALPRITHADDSLDGIYAIILRLQAFLRMVSQSFYAINP